MKLEHLIRKIICAFTAMVITIGSMPLAVFANDVGAYEKNGEIIELTDEDIENMENLKERIEKNRRDKEENPDKYISNREWTREDEEISLYAYDHVYEEERNDTFSSADRVYTNEIMHASIDDEDDVDVFKIKYNEYGVGALHLYYIPSGCDYDLELFDSDEDQITGGYNMEDSDEYIYFQVVPDEWYYVVIYSASGSDEDEEYRLKVYELDPFRANLYASDQGEGSINTLEDNEAGEEWFGGMGYEIDRYDDPRRSDFYEMEGASIITLSGHGTADTIKFKDADNTTSSKCGVKNGESETIGNYKYVGIEDVDLGACKLVVLAACLTASESEEYSRNISENMVRVGGAEASIGWTEMVYSPDMSSYLYFLYMFLAQGNTIYESKNLVKELYGDYDPTVYENVIYGNEDVTLEIPDGPIAQAEIPMPTYIPIKEKLNIDIATGDFEELTEYLEETVDIFDRDTFVIDEESSSGDDRSYSVFYYYMKDGFKTAYYIVVRCTDGVPEKYYISVPDNLSALYTEKTISADDIPETVIDEAKAEALKDINEGKYKGLRIISQTVTPRIYEDGYKYLRVRTIFEYEDDGEVYQSPHRFEYRLPDKWQG